MDLAGWLAQHARVCDAIKWETADGLQRYTAWPQARRNELGAAVDHYLGGTAPPLTVDPPNVLNPADAAVAETAFSTGNAWPLYRAYCAHSLAADIGEWFTWRLDDYSDGDLARLLSSATLFRLVHGNYQLDHEQCRGVPAPPHVARAFLQSNGIVVDRRDDTTGKLLEWCRDNLAHFSGTKELPTKPDVATMEAFWQYRGWPPATRIISGTTSSRLPDAGQKHWTAGCWGTSGFLRTILRAINVPCASATTHDGTHLGHSLPHFPAEDAYLSHGDDPYSTLTKAVPEITGRDLMISTADYRSRFGGGQGSKNVGYRVWQLTLGEAWRGRWTAGWTSIVPLHMGDVAHYLAYKIGDGEVSIDRVRPGGQDVDQVWGGQWGPGWSAFVPFTLDHAQYYVAYKTGTGEVTAARIRPDGRDVDTVWETTWTTGWSAFAPFTLDHAPHHLAYKGGTGEVSIDRIRPGGLGVDTIWNGNWGPGWSALAAVPTRDALLFLRTGADGRAVVDRVTAAGAEQVWAGATAPGWTSLVPFTAVRERADARHVALHNHRSGAFEVAQVGATGPGRAAFSDGWTAGWTSVVPLKAHERPWYLTYKVGDGTVAINHLCG